MIAHSLRSSFTSRRGVALLLAMIAVMVSSIIAYTYLAAQETSIGIALNIKNHARARFVAETGLDLTLAYIASDSNWRTNRAVGVWASNVAFGPGFYTLRCDDGIDTDGDGVVSVPGEGYANLNNKGTDPFTLTVTGTVGGCTHTVRAIVRPFYSGPVVLFVVGDDNSLTAAEQERKTLFEGWNWTVNLLDDNSSASQYNTAVSAADVTLVSASASNVGTKLKSAAGGVVNEYGPASSSFGFSSSNGNYTASDSNQINITNNGNYVTGIYSLGTLTVATVGSVRIDQPSGSLAGGLLTLGQRVGSTSVALATIEASAALQGGGTAIDRRVSFPLGRYLVSQMNSDGTLLLRRSLEWASGAAGIAAFGYQNVFATSQANVGGNQVATQATLSEAGTLTSMTAYLSGDNKSHSFRYALYNDSSGQPGTLVVQSNVSTIKIKKQWRWYKLSVTATSLTAGTYWLALSIDDNKLKYRYNNGGQTRYNNNDATTGSGFSSSWGSSSSSLSTQINLYGTYTPASGASSSSLSQAGSYDYEDIDLR